MTREHKPEEQSVHDGHRDDGDVADATRTVFTVMAAIMLVGALTALLGWQSGLARTLNRRGR